jgi:hypothetical protein
VRSRRQDFSRTRIEGNITCGSIEAKSSGSYIGKKAFIWRKDSHGKKREKFTWMGSEVKPRYSTIVNLIA